MKIIDCGVLTESARSSDSLTDWLNTLKIGRSSAQDIEAQEAVINSFQRLMDNKYFLLRNVPLESLDMPVPMILVGPTGVWVIYPSGLRGVYRARGDAWEKIDEKHQSYVPTGENLLTETSEMSAAVESKLIENDIPVLQLEPVLVFTNPGIHVETNHPIIRVVLVDALERLASGIVQGRFQYDPDQVQKIFGIFAPPEDNGLAEQDDSVTGKTSAAGQRKMPGSESLERIDKSFAKLDKVSFTSRQWLILGILIVINIIILAGFVLYILAAT